MSPTSTRSTCTTTSATTPSTPRRSAPACSDDRDAWILYHFSIGSPLLDLVRTLDVPLALDYHNITDAKFFWRWEPRAATQMLDGRRQLAEIAPEARFALADSRFNECELVELGCRHTAVAPILLDFADYDSAPDATALAQRREARAAGGADWIAVGRIAPNKCQHDVVLAFAAYRRLYDPHARLTLVGGQSAGEYWRALRRLTVELGIAHAVTFTDVVSHAELLACYRTADVLLCLSEHEGFNVPVLEAMHFDVPVVAYTSTAVPDTVGDGGILLTDKDPVVVASAVDARALRRRAAHPPRRRRPRAGRALLHRPDRSAARRLVAPAHEGIVHRCLTRRAAGSPSCRRGTGPRSSAVRKP